jgi:hypothetical protein
MRDEIMSVNPITSAVRRTLCLDRRELRAGLTILVVLGVAAICLNGCAASRALDKPAPKDYGVLKPGTNRDLVRAELGQAQASVGENDCDVFAFEKGSSGWKYVRAIGYALLDVGTLGVSEVVANPAESGVGKARVRVRVCYGHDQNVAYSERLEVGKSAALMTGTYPPPTAKSYLVSGGIAGLTGRGLTLQLNGSQDMVIADDGAFAFPKGIAGGTPYVVAVAAQPMAPSQTCAVMRGSGTVSAANVTNVSVNCKLSEFALGGQVTGLADGGLTLQDTAGGALRVSSDGAFVFPYRLASGSRYDISVVRQLADSSQECLVSGGTGLVGDRDVSSVMIDCVAKDGETADASDRATSSSPLR